MMKCVGICDRIGGRPRPEREGIGLEGFGKRIVRRLFGPGPGDVAEELRGRLAGMPEDAGGRERKDFPSAADRLREHRSRPPVYPPEASSAAAPPAGAGRDDAGRGNELPAERKVSYSLELPPESEKWYADEAALLQKTFSCRLMRLLEERRIRPAAFYGAAGIDRKLFSAIRCDPCYQPSRETALRCCLALRLGVGEAETLLASAGYAFSDGRRRDLVIRTCIEKGIFSVDDVNTVLDALGEKPFR